MRIGIDARELSRPTTGVGRYLKELLAYWTRDAALRDHRLVLFAPAALDDLGWAGDRGARIDVAVVPGQGGTRWEQGALTSAARAAGLQVFFAPGYTAPLRLRVPIVVAMHDVSFAAHPEWFSWREGLRQRTLARWTARRAVLVLTLTAFSRDEIVRHLGVPPSRVRVIAPGVDTNAWRRMPRPDESEAAVAHETAEPSETILYVGSMFVRRHVPTLIAAFARLRQVRPHVRLVLVGADRTFPPEDIAGCIRRSGAETAITWKPGVSDDELRALYREARVFAFLSSYEGFGLTPLEALAAGVPPVVAESAVSREVCGDAAVYVDPRDARAAAGALTSLLDEGPIRSALLAGAPAVLMKYRWEQTARETSRELLSAAGEGTVA